MEKQIKMSLYEVERFLAEKLDSAISNVSELSSGIFSRAYSYKSNGGEFVLRLNNDIKDFRKDIYAHENFGNKLPISKILKYGKFNDQFCFAIMHRCGGVTHDKLDGNDAEKVLPKIIDMVEKIRRIDVSDKEGYGILDEYGNGRYESWRSAIISFYNHKLPQINWFKPVIPENTKCLSGIQLYTPRLAAGTLIETLFAGSILSRTTFDYFFKKMFELLVFCPEEKHLVHGDFGFDNLLVHNGKITGVIDWAESSYGDFLYDVAWLDFYSDDVEYAEKFKEYYAENKIDAPYFDERINCYRLHIGLSGLIIAAFFKNKQDYEQVKNRLHL